MSGACGTGEQGGGCGGGGCGGGCGGPYVPELDARELDPMIRQSAIFGVLMGLPSEGSVRVVVNTDPSGIAQLLEQRLPGEYSAEVDEVSEDEYRVLFARA
ncbi:DUF2249 domain-containing protein [Mobilicoccus caccae]|uniref:DUF2249 domain-containing protein n=1 Tax=Mobilicoccus caccae TaxID=1859295 RepID=A0ABQ6IVH7_9MICO|nr:DUF2249 domain-containing protein [Mobilicoccus caccae]GMA41293.1 hypothetical protein GCM10025883_33380 [Mobilicoccus caccae]